MVLAPVGAVCTLPGLWYPFRWTPATDILEGMVPQENTGVGYMVSARSARVPCGRWCAAAGKTPAHARLDGGREGQQKSVRVGHAISKPDGERSCCAGSDSCSCI